MMLLVSGDLSSGVAEGAMEIGVFDAWGENGLVGVFMDLA